jgi:CubicO group peptidase (beta-lactamase class C family)
MEHDGRRAKTIEAGPFVALAAVVLTLCSSCLYSRILYFNTPTLAAPSNFASRTVRASSTPVALRTSAREPALSLAGGRHARFGALDSLLAATRTRAFLVLLDDTIVYERYSGGVGAQTRLPCFSMSKTLAALLVGCAIDDGLVGSTGDPLVAFVPELGSRPGYPEIKLEHLLRMNSGIDFAEASVSGAALYYTTDLRTQMYAYDVRWTPGTRYLYGGVGIQLLWDVLDRRLRGRTVSQYFEQRVWDRLGAESDATWSLDSEQSGIEKLFGGFNATARDYARLGLLFVHGGVAGGRRVVSHDWVVQSLEPDEVAGTVKTSEGEVRRGKYQWFLTMDGCCYFAKGYEGQYVYVHAAKDLVFVRFGEEYGGVDWPVLFAELAKQL